MKYLLTGGSGFIGSHLVDRLLKEEHEVTIVDRSIKWQNLTNRYHQNLKIYQENILGNIAYLFKDIDIVIHLAALTRPQWSIEHPFETNEVNVNGTIKVLENARDAKVKRVVFLSTSNLYGQRVVYPTSEDAYLDPMNAYALSKLVGEQYCQLFEDLYGLEYNVIRPFNAYGTRMPIAGIWTSAVATYINALKKNIPFVKFGSGDQRRDFVYIDDIIEQIMLMAISREHGEIFNCGFGKNYSINEMLQLVRKIMGKEGEATTLERQFEPDRTLADISKAKDLLFWEPRIDLEEGLRRTIEGTL